jgi:hypothetical protein
VEAVEDVKVLGWEHEGSARRGCVVICVVVVVFE